jgi:hypothetical protein
MRPLVLLPLVLLAACGAPSPSNEASDAADGRNAAAANETAVADGNRPDLPPVEPIPPGQPGGLPDDRTPVSEAPFTETSAQGAANVVQSYYALLEQGRHEEAWRLWSDGGRASGMTAGQFAASFARYAEYHAQIGAPGEIEGAAGSLYVEVPVQVYGRLRSGEPFRMLGPVRLRRCNDVPGCTEDQRKWRIADSGVRPRP